VVELVKGQSVKRSWLIKELENCLTILSSEKVWGFPRIRKGSNGTMMTVSMEKINA
jgi:hypothetical protein